MVAVFKEASMINGPIFLGRKAPKCSHVAISLHFVKVFFHHLFQDQAVVLHNNWALGVKLVRGIESGTQQLLKGSHPLTKSSTMFYLINGMVLVPRMCCVGRLQVPCIEQGESFLMCCLLPGLEDGFIHDPAPSQPHTEALGSVTPE